MLMDMTAPQPHPAYAFITWDAAVGRRMCPLAMFSTRAPQTFSSKLVCVNPPLADCEILSNADAIRGSIALVVRGGCSFIEKARRIQAAGAVAMILANNERENPFGMFTMGDDELTLSSGSPTPPIGIPCVMMCLQDVRELFKQYPPSVITGVLTLEIYSSPRNEELVEECERQRQFDVEMHQQQQKGTSDSVSNGGWGDAFKRKTSSLIKRWDTPPSRIVSPRITNDKSTLDTNASEESTHDKNATSRIPSKEKSISKPPLFAFVQWATSATTYTLSFAPLADFCLVANNAIYAGKRIESDPLLAHEDKILNAEALVNAIAVVKRGICTFPAKLERMQRCGATAVIVGNDDAEDRDSAFMMSVDHIKVDHVTIPSVMVSLNIFERLQREQPEQLRILCLSGDAAAQWLETNGSSINMVDIPVPISSNLDDPGAIQDKFMLKNHSVALFHAACRQGDHGECQRLLEELCPTEAARREIVLERDARFHLTALHHACAANEGQGNEHVVSLLLKNGALIDATDLALQTPLHLACLRGHVACVKRLLSTACNTPSIANSSTSESAVALTTAKNLGGFTPLHYAVMAGSTDCLELLLSVNARAVHEKSSPQSSKFRFVGVDDQDVDGSTPLHVAVQALHLDCILYLMAANASLDITDKRGRTPLHIACELVNEPSKSISALHIIEKLMEAGARIVENIDEDEPTKEMLSTPSLAIDCIQSKPVKRELEITFLRREAVSARAAVRRLQTQTAAQDDALHQLQLQMEKLLSAWEEQQKMTKDRERRLERQQTQIKFLLEVIRQGSTISGNSCRLTPNLELNMSASSLNDEERAQEAALARDLGRKCWREQQLSLAEVYFEQSLELYPLPGVSRMLAEVKAKQPKTLDTVSSTPEPIESKTKEAIAKLQTRVSSLDATDETKQSLLHEIHKLEQLNDTTSKEWETMYKWIEWLLVLPWSQENQGNGLVLEATFDELERMDKYQHLLRQHHAAKRIQRVVRDRFARRQLEACIRIQCVIRGALARRECFQRRAIEEAQALTPIESTKSPVVERMIETRVCDFTNTVDPWAYKKLPLSTQAQIRLIKGWRVETPLHFQVVQIISIIHPSQQLGFYVWKRWGETSDSARQSILSGPYEDLETTQQRYERECHVNVTHDETNKILEYERYHNQRPAIAS